MRTDILISAILCSENLVFIFMSKWQFNGSNLQPLHHKNNNKIIYQIISIVTVKINNTPSD